LSVYLSVYWSLNVGKYANACEKLGTHSSWKLTKKGLITVQNYNSSSTVQQVDGIMPFIIPL